MNYFAKNLKALRENKGVSQAAMGQQLKLGRSRINDYEQSNSTPNLDTLIKISDYFSVTLDDLLKKNLDRIDVLSKINL